MKNKIRWCIIRCVYVAETKSGPELNDANSTTLEIVMSRDKAQTEDFANRHGIKH